MFITYILVQAYLNFDIREPVGDMMFSTLPLGVGDLGSIPALCTIFPIFLTPMTISYEGRFDRCFYDASFSWLSFQLSCFLFSFQIRWLLLPSNSSTLFQVERKRIKMTKTQTIPFNNHNPLHVCLMLALIGAFMIRPK